MDELKKIKNKKRFINFCFDNGFISEEVFKKRLLKIFFEEMEFYRFDIKEENTK